MNEEVVEGDIKKVVWNKRRSTFYMEYSQSVKRILERSMEEAQKKTKIK